MISLKTFSRTAAVIGVAVLASSWARAESSLSAAGSTDIYTTDFQTIYTTGKAAPRGHTVVGSTDIYATDFQTVFPSNGKGTLLSAVRIAGSTDIYTTDFQQAFL